MVGKSERAQCLSHGNCAFEVILRDGVACRHKASTAQPVLQQGRSLDVVRPVHEVDCVDKVLDKAQTARCWSSLRLRRADHAPQVSHTAVLS